MQVLQMVTNAVEIVFYTAVIVCIIRRWKE